MRIALLATFICLAVALPRAHQVKNLSNPNRIPGEFLIVLRRPVANISNVEYVSEVTKKIAAISSKITVVRSFTNLKAPILHVKTSDGPVISSLFDLPEVDAIDIDLVQPQAIQQVCQTQATTTRLWGLSRINVRDLPNFVFGSYEFLTLSGSGVNVYVLDTGVRVTHDEFQGRASFGANFAGGSDTDENGHGTHCAGLVAGIQFGSSKAANIVSVKVAANDGSAIASNIIAGLDFVVGDAGSSGAIASVSLSVAQNDALDSAAESTEAANIPVITAAGNSNGNACNFSPAASSGAITVASTDTFDVLSDFSNFGSCVDLLAPGYNIISASHFSDWESSGKEGTSQAASYTAGIAAIYLYENPGASAAQVRSFLESESTKGMIDMRGTTGTPNSLIFSTCLGPF